MHVGFAGASWCHPTSLAFGPDLRTRTRKTWSASSVLVGAAQVVRDRRTDAPAVVRGRSAGGLKGSTHHLGHDLRDVEVRRSFGMSEQHVEWIEDRRYLGLDVLGRSRPTSTSTDTITDEVSIPTTIPALSA